MTSRGPPAAHSLGIAALGFSTFCNNRAEQKYLTASKKSSPISPALHLFHMRRMFLVRLLDILRLYVVSFLRALLAPVGFMV